MTNLLDYDFHDQSLVGLKAQSSAVIFDIECYDDATASLKTAIISFSNVSDIKINKKTATFADFVMENMDATILRFNINSKRLFCFIEWNDFKIGKVFYTEYDFSFSHVDLNWANPVSALKI